MNRRVRRFFQHPVLSVLIALTWLLLQPEVGVVQVLVAVILGLLVPGLVHGFIGEGARPRRLWLALRFVVVVIWDIVVSNVTVARIVLSPTARPNPAWVPVPLDAEHPLAITLLATIITTTPGTVSCVVDEERRQILVHALDCDDVPAMSAAIKERYEIALKEILG